MTRCERLLRDLEDEPEDCGFIEIEEMLDACGITGTLPGEDRFGYRLRVHPMAPDDPIYYPLQAKLPKEQVRAICRAVRRLYSRLGRTP